MSQTAGQRWAKEATGAQLDRLGDFDFVRDMLRYAPDGTYTLAEHAAFAIEGLDVDEYDRDEAARFWEPYSNVDDDFVDLFIEGALSDNTLDVVS